jgi:hypothetical protein
MYVMSSLRKHQPSVAGGIFNTATKLAMAISLGITTAIFDGLSAARPPASSTDTTGLTYAQIIHPNHAVWWLAAASAGSSLVIVWGLRLGTQGGVPPSTSSEVDFVSKEKSEMRFAVQRDTSDASVSDEEIALH